MSLFEKKEEADIVSSEEQLAQQLKNLLKQNKDLQDLVCHIVSSKLGQNKSKMDIIVQECSEENEPVVIEKTVEVEKIVEVEKNSRNRKAY